MVNLDFKIRWETRYCTVDGEPAYFHTWEQWSNPVPASNLTDSAPAGIMSMVFGIVEFSDGVRRVDPVKIKFCDEENVILNTFKRYMEERDD